MSLSASLRIGNSALTASQQAIQTTGNNLANAATPGYSRQVVRLAPVPGAGQPGIGRGVILQGVVRQIDVAVQTRLWSGVSDEHYAAQQHQLLSQVEASLNELTGHDLSSQLGTFFDVWSERAGLVETSAVVVQQGEQLAGFLRQMRADLVEQRNQIDRMLEATVRRADGLLKDIAGLNREIVLAEGAGGSAGALRDQRDQLIGELSQYLDASVQEQPGGAYDVLVGSTPVVLGSRALSLSLHRETVGNDIEVSVRVGEDRAPLSVGSGNIGALLDGRQTSMNGMIERLDSIAGELIFQTNRLHATGTNTEGLATAMATLRFDSAHASLALNDPLNATMAAHPFAARNGGFYVHVTDQATGKTTTSRIDIDLDGIGDDGLAHFEDDTSLEDIRAQLDAVAGISATITSDGRLRITTEAGLRMSFSDDSSDVLAALGVNTYFTGTTARDIAVRDELKVSPSLLMTGRLENGTYVENGTAIAIAGLRDTTLDALGGESISSFWSIAVQDLGIRTAGAGTRADAAAIVRQGIEAQREALSGVNIDEEAINLMTYQRQYQGAARFISVVDQLTQELIALI